MSLLLLVLLIAAPLFFRAVPVFESMLCILIVTPILWFLAFLSLRSIGVVTLSSLDQTSGIFGYLFIILILLAGAFKISRKSQVKKEEAYPFLVFLVAFSICYYLSLSWPDFINMGERLRDYALLSASIKNPLDPEEPWMSGATLNYYPFWYRFGHMLHTLLFQPTWDIYHIMMSFSLAAYVTVVFRVLQTLVGFTLIESLIGATAIAFGSNVSGIVYAFTGDDGWWGPSRVIAGAINEFPVWSFILGDLHPHYLNLAIIPLSILILSYIAKSGLSVAEKNIYLFLLSVVPLFFLFESNPWEIPMWGGFCLVSLGISVIYLCALPSSKLKDWFVSQTLTEKAQLISGVLVSIITVLVFLIFRKKLTGMYQFFILALFVFYMVYFVLRNSDLERLKAVFFGLPRSKTISVLLFLMLVILSLYLATSHIKPEGGTLKLVRPPILRTTISELFLHWGIPLTLLSVSSLMSLPGFFSSILAFLILAVSIITGEAMMFIYSLIIIQLIRLYMSKGLIKNILSEAILLSGLGLILLPEIIFLDDPYGGENERMNTIFKIYTTAWFLIHVGALYLTSVSLNKKKELA